MPWIRNSIDVVPGLLRGFSTGMSNTISPLPGA
jgi:hypothetical protein